jgi:hypothetical protein
MRARLAVALGDLTWIRVQTRRVRNPELAHARRTGLSAELDAREFGSWADAWTGWVKANGPRRSPCRPRAHLRAG